MYAKRYTNKKGQEKVEILLSLEEATIAVNNSPAELVRGIKAAIDDASEANTFTPRGAPGELEGLKILFDEKERPSDTAPS